MPKMIQIRHVPDPLHRKLESRAALEGLSLSDYLLREMKRIAETPTLAELQQRLSQAAPVNPRIRVERIIRKERDTR
jgi:plasmid stability protein